MKKQYDIVIQIFTLEITKREQQVKPNNESIGRQLYDVIICMKYPKNKTIKSIS